MKIGEAKNLVVQDDIEEDAAHMDTTERKRRGIS